MAGIPPQEALNSTQQSVIDQLRRPSEEQRRVFDVDLAERIRLELESSLSSVITHVPEGETIVVTKSLLERVHGCQLRFLTERSVPFEWTTPMARGAVAHKAIEIAVVTRTHYEPLELIEEAIVRIQNTDSSLGNWLASASEASLDEIRAQANNYYVAFIETWPRLKASWRPAVEASMRAEFFEGRLVLSGKPDLTLGSPQGPYANKVIVDFKTGGVRDAHRADMGLYALLDTLRLGTPPRMVATSYLHSGKLHVEEVTTDTLERALDRTIDGVARFISLIHTNSPPTTTPNNGCRWCPALSTCEAGRRYLAEETDEDLSFAEE